MSDEPKKINNLEDALKIVDDSNLPPAPESGLPFPIYKERNIPVTTLSEWSVPTSTRSNRQDTTSLISEQSTDSTRLVRNTTHKTRPVRSLPGIKGFIRKLRIKKFYSPKHNEDKIDTGIDPDLDIGPANFKMKFDFESAYRDAPEDRPFRLRREKRTGLIGGILLAVFIICVSIVLASVAWIATVDVLGFGSEDEPVNVQVPSGFTLEGITDMLFEAGLINNKALFTLYAEYSNAVDKISEGSYVLNKNFDYRALVQGMTARAGVRVETTVTIPEGYTLAQIFALLEREQVCPAADLWEAATYHDFNFHFLDQETLGNRLRLEGYLFPDTYNFYMDSTPVQAILRMLREFNRRFSDDYVERAGVMGFTVHEIITVASMIEREAGDDDERPRIAAVIYNRLDSPNFPRLEIDATIHYAIAGTGIPFSTDHDSPFNTYIHEGLPPGPIANPGMLSIRAALFPDSTNEFYYALNRHGTHNFFTNYNDHVNFVNSDQYGG